MKLSVLIPTVPRRKEALESLLSSLYPQSTNETEILVFLDDKKRTLGSKRNAMLRMARGEYVSFIDDDDRVSTDYVSKILSALKGETVDVLNFGVEITTDGTNPKKVLYSKDLTEGFDGETYYRLPNQLMAFKRETALKEDYPDVSFGEDTQWANRIAKHIGTEKGIPDTLYFYDYRPGQSECAKD